MYKKKGRENNLGWGENGTKLKKKKQTANLKKTVLVAEKE